ncbi:MAG: sigma 54-interacting transcriptional regulator [Nevskiales bacterium]|nr:sigma 54-interacting transcriptional regulator [Nevskiales bacterium]
MFGFGNRKTENTPPLDAGRVAPFMVAYAPDLTARDPSLLGELQRAAAERPVQLLNAATLLAQPPRSAEFLVALMLDPTQLDVLADATVAARNGGLNTTLVVCVAYDQLTMLGQWLNRRAADGGLSGVRLILAADAESALEQLPERLMSPAGDNVIRMPKTTDVEESEFRNFFVFSPELHDLVGRVRAYAENGVHRVYLLGGPGSGKTSLAYYYYLARKRGRFVTVNLAAENTGDKAAVKSLLCGHVTGAFPGAGARTGAFQHARDGVCFIDESHGIAGPVMEVLMEAFDNGQYLPLGASAKQRLESAIVFATNRSWQHLQDSVNIDEFTRLGAATLKVPELSGREEDMIAVVATSLSALSARCTTWSPPKGVTHDAWRAIRGCRWHGNIRALIRVMESAFVEAAIQSDVPLLQADQITQGIELWEPRSHHSHQLYAVNMN